MFRKLENAWDMQSVWFGVIWFGNVGTQIEKSHFPVLCQTFGNKDIALHPKNRHFFNIAITNSLRACYVSYFENHSDIEEHMHIKSCISFSKNKTQQFLLICVQSWHQKVACPSQPSVSRVPKETYSCMLGSDLMQPRWWKCRPDIYMWYIHSSICVMIAAIAKVSLFTSQLRCQCPTRERTHLEKINQD